MELFQLNPIDSPWTSVILCTRFGKRRDFRWDFYFTMAVRFQIPQLDFQGTWLSLTSSLAFPLTVPLPQLSTYHTAAQLEVAGHPSGYLATHWGGCEVGVSMLSNHIR